MDGQSALAAYILDWVVAQASESDFGIFIFAPDDRWGNQVNGNVLLEVGTFVARIGRERCLILSAKGMDLPSDLKGIVTAVYDPAAFESEGESAITPAITVIAQAIAGRTNLAQSIRGLWLETKKVFKSEGSLSLVEFYVARGELKVRGRSYNSSGEETLEWPYTVDYSHVLGARREVWHTFDARFGRGGRDLATGVSCFRFDTNNRTGNGYFIVSGEGRIQQGLIEFTLARLISEPLTGPAGANEGLSFDDKERCRQYLKNLLAARADSQSRAS